MTNLVSTLYPMINGLLMTDLIASPSYSRLAISAGSSTASSLSTSLCPAALPLFALRLWSF